MSGLGSGVLAEDWRPARRGTSWRALTWMGGVVTVTKVAGGWQAIVDGPTGLWDTEAERSGTLPSKEIAQAWAERTAREKGW